MTPLSESVTVLFLTSLLLTFCAHTKVSYINKFKKNLKIEQHMNKLYVINII